MALSRREFYGYDQLGYKPLAGVDNFFFSSCNVNNRIENICYGDAFEPLFLRPISSESCSLIKATEEYNESVLNE